jgi:hypothetical protein
LDTGQLADVIEHAYDRGEHADWEVVSSSPVEPWPPSSAAKTPSFGHRGRA